MVTTKRKSATQVESDKIAEAQSSTQTNATSYISDDVQMMYNYVDKSAKRVVEPHFVPSPVVRATKPVEQPVAKTVKKEETEKQVKAESEVAKKESLLTPAMKKALMIYLIIVVALTSAVIATGVYVNTLAYQINDYSTVVEELSQTIALQESSLEALNDTDVIAQTAAELGMVDASSSVSGSSVVVSDAKADIETNWFDEFCDWISGMLGG